MASYTPTLRGGRPGGLLVERPEGARTEQSFLDLTGSGGDYAAWQRFYGEVAGLAEVVAPTLLQPLPLEREIRDRVDPAVWRDIVSNPLGQTIEARFADDTVRGVVATDALIGTFASMNDPSLLQNRCFLYHLIGNGTGEWRVPIGGMGAVTDALARAATAAGAEILTSAGVSRIDATDDSAEITWDDASGTHHVTARHVLANVAPWVLQILLGGTEDPESKPAGSQLKINMLLDRLPRLRSGADPEVAFAGTLHLEEDYSQLEEAYDDAAAGRVPRVLPGEIYCHSLTDPSILGEAQPGTHTLTYFGVHTPSALFERDPEGAKRLAVARALRVPQPAPRGSDRVVPGHRRRRPTVPGGEDPAGHRARSRDARRPHLPRRPGVALGTQPGPPRDARAAVGRADRRRVRARLRLRIASRWRGLRPRRAQCRARRTGLALSPVTKAPLDFSRWTTAGIVHVASPRAALAQLAEQLTLNQRVRGSSP